MNEEGGSSLAHPNVDRLQAFLDAYAAGDRDALARSLAPDAVWHVGGTHRFSGDYRGRASILEYFDAVAGETSRTLKLAARELLANDQRGAVMSFTHVAAKKPGAGLDVIMADAMRFGPDGRVLEFWTLSNDQAAVDAFIG